MKKLEDYVLAARKEVTVLHAEVCERINKYPDEDPYFYLPQDDKQAREMLSTEKCMCAYVETLQWLHEENEDAELMLLLYRGSHFLSLYFATHEGGFLDVLFHLMKIDDDQYNISEIANGIDWDVWLKAYPTTMENTLQQVTAVGFCINPANMSRYEELQMGLIDKYELNIDLTGQNPWHFAPFHHKI